MKIIKEVIKNTIFNVIFILSILIIVLIFYKRIWLTFGLLLIVSVIGLIKWKSKVTLIIFFYGFIVGTISEMICVYFGVWQYSFSNLLGVPIWLFLVWGNTAASIYQHSLEIKRVLEPKKK